MYACVRHETDFQLARRIRDDGPLPEVITDVLQAQMLMRERLHDVTFSGDRGGTVPARLGGGIGNVETSIQAANVHAQRFGD